MVEPFFRPQRVESDPDEGHGRPERPAHRLGKSARQARIMTELSASPLLRASDLAAHLGVSGETIRRDLVELGERGLINRTYGGAARPFALEPALGERERMLVAERRAIGAAVADMIGSDEVLMMGAGSTTLQVARHLAARQTHVTVITHAFNIATMLATNPAIRVLVCPGRFNGRDAYVYGSQTIAHLAGFEANRAIVGATGIGLHGANEADDEAAAVFRTMIARSAETIIVADHSKFNQPALSVFAPWDEIDKLVTDQRPAGTLARTIERASVEIVLASRVDAPSDSSGG
jgi:DeoR/GlpR family transcriptional regulator of sugar metabolism